MRKNLLGMLAIGGALAYAHKRRGGELTLASVKDTVNNLIGTAKGKLNGLMSSTGMTARDAESAAASDDNAYSSGFASGSTETSPLRH